MTGNKNAAVFPDPVWALAMRSRPLSTIGNEYFWTGVGTVYLALLMFSRIDAWSLASSKESKQGGTSVPETETGISLYFEKFIPVFEV